MVSIHIGILIKSYSTNGSVRSADIGDVQIYKDNTFGSQSTEFKFNEIMNKEGGKDSKNNFVRLTPKDSIKVGKTVNIFGLMMALCMCCISNFQSEQKETVSNNISTKPILGQTLSSNENINSKDDLSKKIDIDIGFKAQKNPENNHDSNMPDNDLSDNEDKDEFDHPFYPDRPDDQFRPGPLGRFFHHNRPDHSFNSPPPFISKIHEVLNSLYENNIEPNLRQLKRRRERQSERRQNHLQRQQRRQRRRFYENQSTELNHPSEPETPPTINKDEKNILKSKKHQII